MHSLATLHRLKYTELSVAAVSTCSSLLSFLGLDSPWVYTDNVVSSGLWSCSFDPASSGDWGSRIYAEYREYRTREIMYTSSFQNSPFRSSRFLIYLRITRKEESFLFVFVVGRAKNDSWGVRVVCMRVCICTRRTLLAEREREIERPSKKKSPSCVRVKISNDRAYFSSFSFFFVLRRRRRRWAEIVRLD